MLQICLRTWRAFRLFVPCSLRVFRLTLSYHAPLRVAGGPRQALAAPLGADQGNGQRPLLNYDLCESYWGNQGGDMGSGDKFRFCYHKNLYS